MHDQLDLKNASGAEKRRIAELLQALRCEKEVWTNPESSLLKNAVFLEEFTSRLLCQHVFMGNPLMQNSFDSAFTTSAEAAGFLTEPAPSGQRFWDLKLNGKQISLKTTQAKDLRTETLHISKLTEAAWIQDCRTSNARMEHTKALFQEYQSKVQAIFQFRYFRKTNLYELVEIPTDLFQHVQGLSRSQFSADGPSINIPIGQEPPDFTLKLDRSDAKVTLANILKSRCVLHGTWKIGTQK
ncbi:MAG: hypothetical protein JJU29_11510 [Verrucomicrobia bacterium]|nr:hypothetical protein [Verrucomicrobiota bacterium]MCH8512862.1 hypothetical protein [Kiritimatiellia bacterium]